MHYETITQNVLVEYKDFWIIIDARVKRKHPRRSRKLKQNHYYFLSLRWHTMCAQCAYASYSIQCTIITTQKRTSNPKCVCCADLRATCPFMKLPLGFRYRVFLPMKAQRRIFVFDMVFPFHKKQKYTQFVLLLFAAQHENRRRQIAPYARNGAFAGWKERNGKDKMNCGEYTVDRLLLFGTGLLCCAYACEVTHNLLLTRTKYNACDDRRKKKRIILCLVCFSWKTQCFFSSFESTDPMRFFLLLRLRNSKRVERLRYCITARFAHNRNDKCADGSQINATIYRDACVIDHFRLLNKEKKYSSSGIR